MMRENPPLISVVVPTYNRADLLHITIESVLAQTYPAVELIVVDDGSTDETAALLGKYAGRLIAIHQANQGGAAAANHGFEASSGSLITFLDHDDVIYPDKLMRQALVMQTHPHIDLCYCQHDYMDEHGCKMRRSGPLPEDHMLHRLLSGNPIWSGAPLIRRETLARVGLHDENNWCADWDLWLRMMLAGCQLHCLQDRLGAYRVMQNSSMSQVTRLEWHTEATLRKLFDSGQLPQDLAGLHDESLAQFKWFFSGLYYNARASVDGRRAMAEALRLNPALLADPASLIDALCAQAFDVRVVDAMSHIRYVFDHLPEEAGALQSQQPVALAKVCLGEAARLHVKGRTADSRQLARMAQATDPAFASRINDYGDFVVQIVQTLPCDDLDTMLLDMFDAWGDLRARDALKGRVLGLINLASAFESYVEGRHGDTVQRVLRGVRRQPGAIANRGVWSIFVRSLLRQPRPAVVLSR